MSFPPLSRAAARGIGLAKLVSTSNEADLDIADFVDHLAVDPDTGVIALYIETIRNPDMFRRAATYVDKAVRAEFSSKRTRRCAADCAW